MQVYQFRIMRKLYPVRSAFDVIKSTEPTSGKLTLEQMVDERKRSNESVKCSNRLK